MEERIYGGFVYRRNGPGEPWVKAGPAPSAPAQTVVPPNPAKVRQQTAQTAGTEVTTAGNVIDNQVKGATAPAVISKAQSDAERAAAEAIKAQAEASAAQKEQAAAPNPENARIQRSLQTDSVLQSINTAREQIGRGWATGNFFGTGGWQSVPGAGQNSANLAATLSGLQGSIINDTLAALKAASANGASGYGSLTESEAQRLSAAVGALQQSQDADALKANLAKVERHYRNALALLNNEDPRIPEVAAKYGIVDAPPQRDDNPVAAIPGAGTPPPQNLTSAGKWEADLALRGVNSTVAQMVQQGRSPSDIRAYLNRISPGLGDRTQGIDEAVAYGRQHPNANPTDYANFDLEKQWTPNSGLTQTLGNIGMSVPGSALIGAADIASLGTLDNIAGLLGGNSDQTRAVMSGVQELNPNAYLAGQILGGVTGGLGLEQGLGRAGLGTLGRARAGDVILGAGYGAGAADEPDDSRVAQALLGGVTGYAGGAAGRAIGRGTGRVVSGVNDAAQQLLNNAGVSMTPGQILGGTWKRTEDRLAGLPIIGDQIRARRIEGVQDFNRAAFDDALAPINATTGGITGAQGVDLARAARSQAYDDALGGVRVQADEPFVADMGAAIQSGNALPDPMRANIEYTLPVRVGNSFDEAGGLSGRDYQQALRGLRRDAKAVESQPYGWDFGQVTNQAEDALEGLLRRQSPGTAESLANANAANMNVETLRAAVNAARNGSRSGEVDVFMPSQLADAAAAAAKRFGNNAGTTNQPFFDLTRAGQSVLPSSVPDSGTAGRVALPTVAALLAGGGSYAGQDEDASSRGISSVGAGLVASLLAAAPYSSTARNGLQRLLLSERPEIAQRAGQAIIDNSNIAGLLAAPSSVLYITQ